LTGFAPIFSSLSSPAPIAIAPILYLLHFAPPSPISSLPSPHPSPHTSRRPMAHTPDRGRPPERSMCVMAFPLAWLWCKSRFINKVAHAKSNPIVCHVTPLPFTLPPCPPSPPSSLPRTFPSLFVLPIPAIVCRVAQSLFNLDHSCLISSCTHPAGCCPLACI
jgi:hypothetical protein